MSLSPAHKKILVTAAPIIFVLLWSTGFIGAKMGMPHAEPFTFLAIRFVLASALFILILIVMRVPWPRAPIIWLHASVVGILMQGIYLCGVFYAVYHGTSAGISALIVGVQPVLTAIFAGLLLSERLSGKAWFGLLLLPLLFVYAHVRVHAQHREQPYLQTFGTLRVPCPLGAQMHE